MEKRLNQFIQWIIKRSTIFIVCFLLILIAIIIWLIIEYRSGIISTIPLGIAAISSFFAAISSIAALIQAVEIRRQRESYERPYVVGYIDDANSGLLTFKIENFGNSPANDIEIKISPSPIDFKGRKITDLSLFTNKIRFLPVGKTHRLVIDASFRFFSAVNL